MIHSALCFKPCYKWNTFNTCVMRIVTNNIKGGFKPCYKWNTFNTIEEPQPDGSVVKF